MQGEKLSEYGFVCGDFSVALSGNDIIMPGSKNQPLRKSMLPLAGMNDSAGQYRLEATANGGIICDLPVHIYWLGHESQPEPFLGFKSDEENLIETLRQHQGKSVRLKFTALPTSKKGKTLQ